MFYLLLDIASGAYFHGEGCIFCHEVFFLIYSLLNIELLQSLDNDAGGR